MNYLWSIPLSSTTQADASEEAKDGNGLLTWVQAASLNNGH
jgi:hypothetical protein